jgi:hypothetical protein
LPPAIPFTLHVTPGAEAPDPETLAVKTWPPPVGTAALSGEILMAMSSFRVIAAEPVAAASASLTAVTVTLGGDGRIVGAV